MEAETGERQAKVGQSLSSLSEYALIVLILTMALNKHTYSGRRPGSVTESGKDKIRGTFVETNS